ncbi:putative carboxylesterase [Penicillium brasilianum]|uniref:Putative carboxylesterase n=1 Tax=Penicillium brasilianum TaxID=104259 RepID=A0A1S9RML2_PENBI|nr:putative carboxylesterase [Penicillium brasilianum]
MRWLFPTSLSAVVATALASPSVTIDAGTLKGGKCSGGQSAVYYKGVPFAEPPVGDLRFEPPKGYNQKYSNGVLNSTVSAPTCIQFGTETVPSGEKSEDCLYLDIWAPASATKDSKLPVKVWIYGGSNTAGGIAYPLYDGCNLADTGAVVVTLNYRLGPLGFLALNSAGIYGNQGIQDLILGFKWVQKSISAFGGDPEKVLAFGQSAGATNLYTIATLAEAPSLFKSAIVESVALPQLTKNATAQKLGASFAKVLQCGLNDKSCLQSVSSTDLQNAFSSDSYMNSGIGGVSELPLPNSQTSAFWPIVDGTIVKENPLHRGAQVPTALGYNQQEGTMDTITKYPSAELIANLTAADYTAFLQGDFGPAAQIIEKYYPLSLFESAVAELGLTAGSAVFEAIAQILTDAEYKCPTYQGAASTVRNSNPVWTYEFTHNATCAWLDTLVPIADDLSFIGAAHTAEIPFVFGNLNFSYPEENYTCSGSKAEWDLSNDMIGLWTAMAENGKPSTKAIQWPQFNITSTGSNTPGMVFGNSSTPGNIDFSVCKLWAQVSALLDGRNATATAKSSSTSSVTPTASPTSSFAVSGGVTVAPSIGGSIFLSTVLMGAAMLM